MDVFLMCSWGWWWVLCPPALPLWSPPQLFFLWIFFLPPFLSPFLMGFPLCVHWHVLWHSTGLLDFVLFSSVFFFKLFSLDWIILFNKSSSSVILSSAYSKLLLKPSSEFFHFNYCTFSSKVLLWLLFVFDSLIIIFIFHTLFSWFSLAPWPYLRQLI